MKRIGNLYDQICSLENLDQAEACARIGKRKQYGVIAFDKNREAYLAQLHQLLVTEKYTTSPYTIFKIKERKERIIYRLPYFPDRICHWAIMNVLKEMFVRTFTADTYSCIEGRGVGGAVDNMKIALQDREATRYYLQLDIKKFYPSITHRILKHLLRLKIKCERTLRLLDGIIDSAEGLPIGNYLSQYLANFYLSYFDHWIKEEKKVKYYFRYADDMVILGPDKAALHQLRIDIEQYLKENLNLIIKPNWHVSPVHARPIDFLGYVFYHTHTRMRKRNKQAFARKVARGARRETIEAYKGLASHANCKNLIKKLLPDEQFCRLQHKDRTKNNNKRRKNKNEKSNRYPNQDTVLQNSTL